MIKIERDTLSDEQIMGLSEMLKQYQKMKLKNIFVQRRIKEIQEVLSTREDPIKSKAYQSAREY